MRGGRCGNLGTCGNVTSATYRFDWPPESSTPTSSTRIRKALFPIDGVPHLLVELGLRSHRIHDRADARIPIDMAALNPLRHDCPASRNSLAFFATDLLMIAER